MSARTRIERLRLYRVRAPLTVPYKLSFGPVEAFDMVLVEAQLSDGREGWGEATVLTGYTDETIEQAWRTATRAAPELTGCEVGEAKAHAAALHARAPFTATALVTSIEMAQGHPMLAADGERRTPLLAVINASGADGIAAEIEQRLGEGFRTLKVKVGFALAPDIERLAFIQRRVAGRALLRVDANQGYDAAEGVAFVEGIDPDGVELVEQTCAAGDWDAAVAVAIAARARGVTMMLDESIYGAHEIDRAADLDCAGVIKLKLMKAGGLDALDAGLAHIRRRGMRPVLGNGVASDIGCWMEACVAARVLDSAGEMNGFLKPRTRLFEVPMRLAAGELVLTGGAVRPDRDALRAHTLDTRDFR